MTSEHLDWDNLRYFLAVARAGKLTAAARRLGQDQQLSGGVSPASKALSRASSSNAGPTATA